MPLKYFKLQPGWVRREIGDVVEMVFCDGFLKIQGLFLVKSFAVSENGVTFASGFDAKLTP